MFGVSMFASYISPIIATEIHKRQDAARERAAAAAALAGSGDDVIDRDGDLSQQERDDLEFARELQRQLDQLDNHPGAGVWLRPAPAPPVDAEADRPAPPRPPAPADIVDALVDPPPPPPDEPPPRPPAQLAMLKNCNPPRQQRHKKTAQRHRHRTRTSKIIEVDCRHE